ncbi:MAG: hypothetical protein ACKVON_05410 [Beijerinckiaceae bacterium]
MKRQTVSTQTINTRNLSRHIILPTILAITLAATGTLLAASTAFAQSAIPNPLRTPSERKAEPPKDQITAAPTPDAGKTDSATSKPQKPKRERSAKQKQGDEDMRSCGTSWRNDKDTHKAKGETWRTYLKSCRAQLKSSRGA